MIELGHAIRLVVISVGKIELSLLRDTRLDGILVIVAPKHECLRIVE